MMMPKMAFGYLWIITLLLYEEDHGGVRTSQKIMDTLSFFVELSTGTIYDECQTQSAKALPCPETHQDFYNNNPTTYLQLPDQSSQNHNYLG